MKLDSFQKCKKKVIRFHNKVQIPYLNEGLNEIE